MNSSILVSILVHGRVQFRFLERIPGVAQHVVAREPVVPPRERRGHEEDERCSVLQGDWGIRHLADVTDDL